MKQQLKQSNHEAKPAPQPKGMFLEFPKVDVAAFEATAHSLLKSVLGTRIVSETGFKQVAQMWLKARTFMKNVTAEFHHAKSQADVAHKSIRNSEVKTLAPFEEVLEASEQKMRLWAEENELPTVEGLAYRQDYAYEIVDASKLPREFLSPDPKKIGPVVKALKEEAAKKIPGIAVFPQVGFIDRSSSVTE